MSGHEHLSDDALLDALYGLAEIGPAVRECPLCSARWAQMNQQRARLAEPVEVSSEFLAAQRREIHQRLSEPEPVWRAVWTVPRWAQAVVAVCVLAVGLFWFQMPQPAPFSSTESGEISDTQLFADVSEIYSLEQSFEPTAAGPIRALFEEEN